MKIGHKFLGKILLTRNQDCADFEIRFCCPNEYFDPCKQYGNMCPEENNHVLLQTDDSDNTDSCVCACDEGYIHNGNN